MAFNRNLLGCLNSPSHLSQLFPPSTEGVPYSPCLSAFALGEECWKERPCQREVSFLVAKDKGLRRVGIEKVGVGLRETMELFEKDPKKLT